MVSCVFRETELWTIEFWGIQNHFFQTKLLKARPDHRTTFLNVSVLFLRATTPTQDATADFKIARLAFQWIQMAIKWSLSSCGTYLNSRWCCKETIQSIQNQSPRAPKQRDPGYCWSSVLHHGQYIHYAFRILPQGFLSSTDAKTGDWPTTAVWKVNKIYEFNHFNSKHEILCFRQKQKHAQTATKDHGRFGKWISHYKNHENLIRSYWSPIKSH